jgi:hypothetical protein
MSVTKLVLLEMVTTLIVIEIWKTYNGMELDQVFIDAFLMVIAFYFGQKGMSYTKVDSVIEEEEDPLE